MTIRARLRVGAVSSLVSFTTIATADYPGKPRCSRYSSPSLGRVAGFIAVAAVAVGVAC